MRSFYVYILASQKNGRLYTGVTNNMPRRAWEHRTGASKGYSRRFRIKRLVYVEEHSSIEAAIRREKRIKRWPRRWKIELIEQDNPEWFDLYRRLNR